MLSTGAFNALLKTLEEPPEHVKFFFATTEPNKIPITVLSRCQRFDFAGIAPDQIVATLADICEREGIAVESDALRAVARRASGSMRDAQSLLEQLLSFGGKTLTTEMVHQALGIAPDDRVFDLIEALADHDAARALQLLNDAAGSGVQPVELLNGVLEFLRDVMIESAGATVEHLAVAPGERDRLKAIAGRWPLDSVMAAMQILAETRARLRGSPHGRLLVELAFCRVARLEDLTELGELVGRLSALESGEAPPTPKKKVTPAEASAPAPATNGPPVSQAPRSQPSTNGPSPTPAPESPPALALETVLSVWDDLPAKLGPRLGVHLSRVRPSALQPPNLLVIALPAGYNWVADQCDTPEARATVEAGLMALLGKAVRVRFERNTTDEAPPAEPVPSPSARAADELTADPWVQQITELFEARRLRIDVEEGGPDS